MMCNICGAQDAVIRLCELKIAQITGRAHVDCNGHAQYRSVRIPHDIDESIRIHLTATSTETRRTDR